MMQTELAASCGVGVPLIGPLFEAEERAEEKKREKR